MIGLKRSQRIALGLVFGVFGGLLILAAFVLAQDKQSRIDKAAESYTVRKDDCLARVNQIGFDAVKFRGGRVVIETEGLETPRTVLAQYSVAALACPGWDMERFCMGEECKERPVPGAIMILNMRPE